MSCIEKMQGKHLVPCLAAELCDCVKRALNVAWASRESVWRIGSTLGCQLGKEVLGPYQAL